jgi:simple sugar transport system ATP-binding protein
MAVEAQAAEAARPEASGGVAAPLTLASPPPVLRLEGVTKRFGAFTALDDVTLGVQPGEIHCLLGENGAGKSTLCNIVFGVHRADAGTLHLEGARFHPRGPAHALASGIAMVHQHFSLVPNMSAVENMMLGRARGRLRPQQMRARVQALAATFGLDVDLDRPVEELSVGERQRVEVLKCLLDSPRLLVLDEPTAVLPPREVGGLLAMCRQVAEKGCGVVLVTHKLAEIAEVATRTTVLRRGRLIETVVMRGRESDLGGLVRSMVGREVRPLDFDKGDGVSAAAPAREALRVEELVVKDGAGATRLEVSLAVQRGEIVGLAGVEGNGQSQLGAVLAGLLAPTAGKVMIDGRDVTGLPPRELTRLGVGIVPEDRHAVGCHLGLSVAENLFLGELPRFTRFGLLRREALARAAEERMKAFDVRADGPGAPMSSLSGGNQQKVVLARELSLVPLRFLLAAQPTRGLDVGAVEAVYAQIRAARDRGVGVLLVSSELDELIAVADRILVIYKGRIVGALPAARGQREAIGALMSGRAGEEKELPS